MILNFGKPHHTSRSKPRTVRALKHTGHLTPPLCATCARTPERGRYPRLPVRTSHTGQCRSSLSQATLPPTCRPPSVERMTIRLANIGDLLDHGVGLNGHCNECHRSRPVDVEALATRYGRAISYIKPSSPIRLRCIRCRGRADYQLASPDPSAFRAGWR